MVRAQGWYGNVGFGYKGKDLLEHMQKNQYTSVYRDEVWIRILKERLDLKADSNPALQNK